MFIDNTTQIKGSFRDLLNVSGIRKYLKWAACTNWPSVYINNKGEGNMKRNVT